MAYLLILTIKNVSAAHALCSFSNSLGILKSTALRRTIDSCKVMYRGQFIVLIFIEIKTSFLHDSLNAAVMGIIA